MEQRQNLPFLSNVLKRLYNNAPFCLDHDHDYGYIYINEIRKLQNFIKVSTSIIFDLIRTDILWGRKEN